MQRALVGTQVHRGIGMKRHLGVTLLGLGLVGCQLPGTGPAASVPELAGAVSFEDRRVQATMTDVAGAATVSLINTSLNKTEATTVTNDQGAFRLAFPTTFHPTASDSFYLEAVKGLNSNLPGANAARVRTIAVFNGGWTTITNTVPNSGIIINPGTTALAIGAALKGADVTPADLIGHLNAATYTPVTNLSDSDFTALKTLVSDILTDDQDPVAGVAYVAPSTWNRLTTAMTALSVTGLSVASGSVGTAVTVTGTGFESTIASDSVQFNGVAATVTAASATSLTTSVPAGATTGKVTVKVGASTAEGPVFTVTGLILGSVATQSNGVVGGTITSAWRTGSIHGSR